MVFLDSRFRGNDPQTPLPRFGGRQTGHGEGRAGNTGSRFRGNDPLALARQGRDQLLHSANVFPLF